MRPLTCDMCGSTDVIKQEGLFVCQYCGTKYAVEEARRMMTGTVDVSGSTVRVDNSAFVEKCLQNARRAKQKEDWEESEKYYNLVEQNAPSNIEAVFYSAYAKACATLLGNDMNRCRAAFTVLGNSISVIDDYFDSNDREAQVTMVTLISNDLLAMFDSVGHSFLSTNLKGGSLRTTTMMLFRTVCLNFVESLEHIIQKDSATAPDLTPHLQVHRERASKMVGGCYVATAVYGSYDCPQVWTLRRFRDGTLAGSPAGRAFIRFYYAVSPGLVRRFGKRRWFGRLCRRPLDRLVARLQAKGVPATPYDDRIQ